MANASDSQLGAMADRTWRGYDLRAAIPLFALALASTVVLLAGRWYMGDIVAQIVPYLLVLAVWPLLLGLALYRAVTYTYRITDRALLVDRGFRNRPEPVIWFAEVLQVTHGASWMYRQLDVGWVGVTVSDGRTLKLTAVRNPAAFAAMLRERMKVSGPVP